MRNSYLESYYNIIPKIQQDRLLEILKKRFDDAGQDPEEGELNNQLKKAIAELDKPLGTSLTQYRKATKYGKISSAAYNNTMEEVYVDLGALFKQSNTITKTMKTHRLLNGAVLKDVRAALRKVDNDIRVYSVIKENKTGITDAVFNSFYKDDSKSREEIFRASVDVDTNSLTLPVGSDHSALSINGLAMAEINLTHFGGGIKGTLEQEDHRKEKAIDESRETFWAEVVLTDEPIKQIYNDEVHFGAICEIVVKLFRAELVNHIKYIPFSNYPLTVLAIKYREKNTDDWSDLGITRQLSTSALGFNFAEISAKEIKIVINQLNPSINTYKLPRRVLNNAQMWQQIVDREYSVSTSTGDPIQATQDMIDSVTGWRAYVDATEKYKNTIKEIGKPEDYVNLKDIGESVVDATTSEMTKASKTGADELKLDLYGKKAPVEDKLVEVRKYEYVYGAYDIEIKRLWYLDKGEYISPKYVANGTVVEVNMDVGHVLPSGTSAEYQVATRDDEWKNIVPSGAYIFKERLDVDPLTGKGILRFDPVSQVDDLYRNDDLISPSGYTFDAQNREVSIDTYFYNATAAYTVSYDPKGIDEVMPSGVIVSFANDSLIEDEEIFIDNQSRQYKVELNHFPHVNYSILNDTSEGQASGPSFQYIGGRWYNSGVSSLHGIAPGDYYDMLVVTVDGYPAENRTDYYELEHPALTEYNFSKYPIFEYIHSGKSVYINTPLKDREISVIYKYLNDYIQFKVLLRKNNKSNVTETPIINDYTLKLRTI